MIINHAVRWYFRFHPSLREIEELPFERGAMVSYETIRRRCEKFGAGFAQRVKAARQGRRQTLLQACVRSNPAPRKIVTDLLNSYPAAKAGIPELANVKDVFVKSAARFDAWHEFTNVTQTPSNAF